jgi:hypothetical protein
MVTVEAAAAVAERNSRRETCGLLEVDRVFVVRMGEDLGIAVRVSKP